MGSDFQGKTFARKIPIAKNGSPVFLCLRYSASLCGRDNTSLRNYLKKVTIMTQVQKGKTVPVRPPATYFSYSPDDGYEEHDSPEKAKAADAAIDAYRGEACDGWSDEVTSVTWGVVAQRAAKFGERKRTNEDAHLSPEIQTVCDYYLAPEVTVPASLPFLQRPRCCACLPKCLPANQLKSGNDDSWRSRASNAAVEYADIVDAENIAAGLTPLSPPADLMPRIYAEARRAYRQYRSGVAGQTVTDADNPDFLLVMAAWQMFVGLNGERQDGKKP
jgi:hypothetical protein